MHFRPCKLLCTGPATLLSQRPTSCSALDITQLLRVHASCLVDCALACLQGDWQYPCHFLKAYLSTRFRQKAVNQWAESLFQTPGSKLYPKPFYARLLLQLLQTAASKASTCPVPESPLQCAASRGTVQNVICNCNALRS